MPGGRPKLSEEEKAKRAAAKEEATLAKAKAREDAKAAKAKAKPKGRVGRPPKSLADRVQEVRSGKVQVKNLYKEPEILFRAVQFPKSLTHALPKHIVSVLSERSPTRQAVAADPDVTDAALYRREAEALVESKGADLEMWMARERTKYHLRPYIQAVLAEKLSAKK